MSKQKEEDPAAELDAALSGTVKVTHDRPDEGVWEGEISDVRLLDPNSKFAGDDDYKTMMFIITNVKNPEANDATYFVNLYADRDPATNDWVRNEAGQVVTRGLENASIRTNWGKLCAAVWPKEQDRQGKTPRDMMGARIAVEVKWERKKDNPHEKKSKVMPLPLSELGG